PLGGGGMNGERNFDGMSPPGRTAGSTWLSARRGGASASAAATSASCLNITLRISPPGGHGTGDRDGQARGYSAGWGRGASSAPDRAAGRVRNSCFTNTKNKGTKKIARKVAVKAPPTTARPMAFWLPAPGPLATASGVTPN